MPFQKIEIIYTHPLLIIIVSVFLISITPVHSQTCPFDATSASALLIEAKSGEILYSQNPSQPIQPASLAKIMTLYLIFDAIDKGDITLTDEVVVSQNAAQKKAQLCICVKEKKPK